MAYFGDQLLDDVRRAISVRTLVERRHKLRKRGANELVAVDDNSLTVNTLKNIWNDFALQKGGDIFSWQQHITGCSFEEAVTQLAHIAGVQLPRQRTNGAAPASTNGHAREEPPPWTEGPPAGHPAAANGSAVKREPKAVYNYIDSNDVLLYQVCRFEFVQDGKRRKITPPRCPVDGDPDHWRWGLKGGDYIRSPRNGDWYALDDKRAEQWAGAEVRPFLDVTPTLYRLPEVLDEMRMPLDEQQPVFIPEGEKDADTLAKWGLLSTTSMGGVNGWLSHYPDYLANADVVILPDHDSKPDKNGVLVNHGMRFAQHKAHSLKHLARRVRVLDWAQHWPGVPHKGDVTKWRDEAGGNLDRFLEIVDKLKDWVPQPPESAMGALRFVDLDGPRKQLEWLIKGVFQRSEMSVWFGDWGTGKSFLITDAAFAIARGVSWMGQRTRPGLVLYQAGEGGIGFGNRMEAYRRNNQLQKGDDIPFVALRARINLFDVKVDDVGKMIAEIKAWAAFYDMPPELVVIDTFSAATAGADENSGRDVGAVLERCRRISIETGAHVVLVHHVPKSGATPRGWSGILGNVDSAALIETLEQKHEETAADGSRVTQALHQITVIKQKDAPSKLARQFTLPQIKLGVDADGDDITSCIVREVGDRVARSKADPNAVPPGWAIINNEGNASLMRSLVRALAKKGRGAPPGVEAPAHARVITVGEWQAEEVERLLGHEEITTALKNRIKTRIRRACEYWSPEKSNLVGKSKEFVWRTERRVHGVDRAPAPITRAPDPTPLLAAGEDPNAITALF